MQALAMDMGGTHIGCAVVRDQSLLAQESIACEGVQTLKSLLPQISDLFHLLLRDSGVRTQECAGLAMGFPGIVDARTAKIYSTLKKFEDAKDMDLIGWCQSAFGLPLRVENDARMALLGESYAGSARGFSDAIMMTLGTGIGGAAMMHGRIIRGKHAQAACLGGHLPVDFHGRACVCGNIGCAEAEAAGWSMPLVVQAWVGYEQSSLAKLARINFKELFEHAERGDRVAAEVRQRCLEVWASNAVANVHAYDPDLVVIGGGVMQGGASIVPFVQQYINEHAWSGWGKPEVRAAELGNSAALLGAVPLLSEQMDAASI